MVVYGGLSKTNKLQYHSGAMEKLKRMYKTVSGNNNVLSFRRKTRRAFAIIMSPDKVFFLFVL